MEFTHRKENNKGNFELMDGAKKAGFIEYLEEGSDVLVISHTEVDPGYEGQGLGKQLVHGAADFAKTHQMKIRALCPYAKKILSRSEEYQTLLV